MAVYFLQFHAPLGNDRHSARFYVGYCEDSRVNERLEEHRAGHGAAITRAAAAKGIGFDLVALIPGAGRDVERRIKKEKRHSRVIARVKRGTYGSRLS